MATKNEKSYWFMVVAKSSGGFVSEYGEVWEGRGATPEKALEITMEMYDIEEQETYTVFFFTLEADDKKRQQGFLKATRTALKIERV
jgi:hypothetical protein